MFKSIFYLFTSTCLLNLYILLTGLDADTLLVVFQTACEVIHQSIFQLPSAKDLTPGSSGEVWLKVSAIGRYIVECCLNSFLQLMITWVWWLQLVLSHHSFWFSLNMIIINCICSESYHKSLDVSVVDAARLFENGIQNF